jgi:AraC family L-rhamnose operon regulatory protein RhaS
MYQPGGISGPRHQRDFQLVFLHSGELWASVDGKRRRLEPGQVGLFVPGKTELFEFSKTLQSHHSWCSVAPSLLPDGLAAALQRASEVQAYDDVSTRLLSAGMAVGQASTPGSRDIIDHIGVALLVAYTRAAEQAESGVVARAVQHMQQHLTDEDCLQTAHIAAGVSRNTLINRFRAELQVTPARHLWRLRAERGIAMLAETGSTIAEIAYACGFRDPFHFSRHVKALQGLSPTELRRKLWSKPA